MPRAFAVLRQCTRARRLRQHRIDHRARQIHGTTPGPQGISQVVNDDGYARLHAMLGRGGRLSSASDNRRHTSAACQRTGGSGRATLHDAILAQQLDGFGKLQIRFAIEAGA